MAVGCIGAVSYYLYNEYQKIHPIPSIAPIEKGKQRGESEVNRQPKSLLPELQKLHKAEWQIAIIIDDIGWDKDIAEEFLEISYPLSFSILPYSPFGRHVANKANAKDRDILLHIPMEPYGYPRHDPGKGTLLTNMDKGEIYERLDDAIRSIPHIVGLNNHMGSKFTEERWAMKIVMDTLKKKELFFIDSLTSPKTLGYTTAKEMGVKTAKRNVFLDNKVDIIYIKNQIKKLIPIAKKRGYAIGIGHPHKDTLTALKDSLPEIELQGGKVVPVSRVIKD